MNSMQYYDQNAKRFYDRTIHADLTEYKKFLHHLPNPSKILDAGCGVGRDTKYFQDLGHEVYAFDGSIEMVKLATQETGKEVLHRNFQDITYSNEFDAIWAMASLLHVPYADLRIIVMQKFHQALKPQGLFLATFKYGDTARQAGNRIFYDMNESNILPHLEGYFEPIDIWKNDDTRSKVAASPAKAWLNILCRAL